MFWLWIAILCAVSCWSNGVDAMKPHAHMSIKALCAGKTYEVKVKASDRVGEVCSALCRSNGINLDQQSVLYRGSVVNKKNTIKQAGIRAGGTIRIKSSMIRKSSGSGVDRRKVQSKSSVKSPGDVKANIDKLKSKTLTGNDNGKWANSKSKWDLKELQKMLSTDQSKTDTEFMKGLAASLQSNPMELVSELMKGNYLEDLVSDDAALESMRQIIKKNMKQYQGMFPEFASQAKLLVSSSYTFKAAIKMALLNMKMLRGSTTTSGGASSSIFNKQNDSTTSNLVDQIKYKEI